MGKDQAKAANVFWRKQLEVQRMPAPETYYVSPLDRCLSTANITFGGLNLPKGRYFAPVVKEVSGQDFTLNAALTDYCSFFARPTAFTLVTVEALEPTSTSNSQSGKSNPDSPKTMSSGVPQCERRILSSTLG